MPDTYISQFSGEEIDAALRAAQIISGADTPAELRKKLEIRGDTIPVSATDPTPVSEALTASGGGVNPNLLDNWFFGRPVNQRNGYYIPTGVKYNTLSWTEAGTTDKAYPVIGYIGQDPLITVNGTNYIVGKSVQVPGYCTAGYTVDRWRIGNDVVATFQDDALNISYATAGWNLDTLLDKVLIPGATYTLSCLYKATGQPIRLVCSWGSSRFFFNEQAPISDDWAVAEITGTIPADASIDINQIVVQSLNTGSGSFSLKAIKLELGDQQTLAHKENGVWVLNEVPDYGEQLRRCQRYCRVYKAGTTLPCLAYPQMDGGWYASAGLPTNEMRTIPTNNLADGKKVAITDLDGADATHDDMSMTNWGQNENMLCLRISGGSHGVLTSKFPYWIKLKEDLILSADL